MQRADILALSEDDLAALGTRGKVKEARKELDDGRVSGSVVEDEGALRVTWSDGPRSEVGAGASLRGGRCSCNGVGMCKHLIRLALAYQRQVSNTEPTGPWDPGAIDDAELGRHFRSLTLTRARQLDEAGTFAELVRGAKPVARFHVPGCVVRFLVPGDVRYARCDCAKSMLCEHIPLAVWAFRRLPADRRAGVVTAGNPASPIDATLLDLADATVADWVEQGISGANKGWVDRLTRLRDRFGSANLVWPAELLDDLIRQQQSYAGHDARFDPRRVTELLGELIVRLDAIRANSNSLPQQLIRGGNLDRPLEIDKGLFWGLGCAVRVERNAVAICAYLYDCKGAGVVVLTKEVGESEDADAGDLRTFTRLGQRVAVKGVSFASLGGGVLQLETARRSARHELMPGRAGAGVMVQDRLAWEEIAAPILVEEFADLEERLSGLPPSALRPRRLAEDVHVLRIEKLDAARFDVVTHSVQAVLHDRSGQRIWLEHPFTSRGRSGAEALLQRLTVAEGKLLFVSGRVSRSSNGLRIAPLGLVLQKGEKRDLLQPWIEGTSNELNELAPPAVIPGQPADPVGGYLAGVQEALGELIVLGVARADIAAARAWGERARRGEAVGFGGLAARVGSLAEVLERKAHVLRWDPAPAAQLALELAGLTRLAADVG